MRLINPDELTLVSDSVTNLPGADLNSIYASPQGEASV
ncbi:Uncharacterised protein [Yersinia intermedia]|nr:Uncharacterised protein [Yersinia intermedia]